MDAITDLRKQIDVIDDKIMELLNQRYNLVQEIGHQKQTHKKAIMDSDREKLIFDKTSIFSHYPQIIEVYKTIISESRSLQRK